MHDASALAELQVEGFADAQRDNIAWMRRHRLLVTEAEVRQYGRWSMASLIQHSFPGADREERSLLVDVLGWFTVVDDHFDGPIGHSTAQARDLVDALLAVPGARPPSSPPPSRMTAAWAELWDRQVAAMSPAWRERAERDWATCLETFVTETSHRSSRLSPSVQEADLLRRHGSCLYPFMNLLERVTGRELPPALYDDVAFRRLRAHTADIATYINDLYSLDREVELGTPFNTVLIMQRVHGYDREGAAQFVRERVRRLSEESSLLRSRIGARHPVARPYLDGLKSMLDGVRLWTSNTARYRETAEAEPAEAVR